MSKLSVIYDGNQQCTTTQVIGGSQVVSDASSSAGGKGQELSPGELVGAGVASCMLFSMGILAQRDQLDITGTRVDVDVVLGEDRIRSIDLTFELPHHFSDLDCAKLEMAAGICPIKQSFLPDVRVSSSFRYPELAGV